MSDLYSIFRVEDREQSTLHAPPLRPQVPSSRSPGKVAAGCQGGRRPLILDAGPKWKVRSVQKNIAIWIYVLKISQKTDNPVYVVITVEITPNGPQME